MKTNHTFGTQFIFRTTKHDKITGNVFARITVDKKRVEISLKKSIGLNYWNKGKGCAKGSNPESYYILKNKNITVEHLLFNNPKSIDF